MVVDLGGRGVVDGVAVGVVVGVPVLGADFPAPTPPVLPVCVGGCAIDPPVTHLPAASFGIL